MLLILCFFCNSPSGNFSERREQKIVNDLAQLKVTLTAQVDGFSNFPNLRNKIVAANDPAI